MAIVVKSGHYAIGTPVMAGRSWGRKDTYHSEHKDLDGCVDHVHVAGRDDATPVFDGRYDPGCPCCWLHFAHSVAKHDQALASAGGRG